MDHELASNETVHIKQLKIQLAFLQWFILAVGIIMLISFSLSNHLFENVIFLPIIGLIGYIFTHHIFMLPSITTLLLLITRFLMDWVSPDVDTLWNYVFYFFIFFTLTLIGSLCGYFLLKSIKYFKNTHGFKKIGIIFSWLVLAFVIIILLINFIIINGNPFSTYLAECSMQWHLKNTYPDEDIRLSNVQYFFKTRTYTADASLYNETDASQIFEIKYTNGHVTDNYFETYLEDLPNEYRINKQIRSELITLLQNNNVAFSCIESNLKLKQKIYDHIDFDKSSFDQPLSLTFTLLTDQKQNNKAFSKWCEAIRQLLISNGYTIHSLCFKSSPHWDDNSLVLFLSDKELTYPIEDLASYKHFTDLGTINNVIDSERNPVVTNDYYDNYKLSTYLESELTLASSEPLYVTASTNSLGQLKLLVLWTGKRISVDSYAQLSMTLFDQLINKHLLNGYVFQSITFKYCWGTESQSYEYTIYPENRDEQTSERIVSTLLND